MSSLARPFTNTSVRLTWDPESGATCDPTLLASVIRRCHFDNPYNNAANLGFLRSRPFDSVVFFRAGCAAFADASPGDPAAVA
jgi:hypothetical protein